MRVNRFIKNLGFSWFVVLSVFLFTSCDQKTFETKKELMEYITDLENEYLHRKSVNGIDYTILYKPTDLLVQQELSTNPTKKELDSLRNKYKKYMYFNISLSKKNQEVLSSMGNDRNEFGTMVNKLVFGMSEKVHLFSKTKDTLEMANYVYPRLYGMGNSTSMMFVYKRDTNILNHNHFYLTVEDIGLKTGEVKFKIPTKPILNEPNIIIN